MADISIKTGSEGPKHDPYGYTEITFIKTDGTIIKHHEGLGSWCEILDKNCIQRAEGSQASELFFLATGCTPNEARKYFNKAEQKRRSICPECNSRNLEWHRGYPGEEILICEDCNSYVDCVFNESAVI